MSESVCGLRVNLYFCWGGGGCFVGVNLSSPSSFLVGYPGDTLRYSAHLDLSEGEQGQHVFMSETLCGL